MVGLFTIYWRLQPGGADKLFDDGLNLGTLDKIKRAHNSIEMLTL